MNPKHLNLILWLTTVLLLVACVGLAYVGIQQPLELPREQVRITPDQSADSVQAENHDLPTLESLAQVGDLELRQQLIKEPTVVEAPQPVAPVPPAPRLDLRLTGTVIESDRPYAILDDARGTARLVRVGDEVKEARVMAITAESITLKVREQEVTLEVAKDELQNSNRRLSR